VEVLAVLIADVSAFAAELRRQGFEARNLGRVGITVWKDGEGFYFSIEELRELRSDGSAHGFGKVLAEKRRQRAAA
jgi:hypothetical protein